MKQVVIGVIGVLVGAYVSQYHMVSRNVADVSDLRSGRWEGRYAAVPGVLESADGKMLLLSRDRTTAIRVEGSVPAGSTQVLGRLRRVRGKGRVSAPCELLPYSLDANASRVDVAGVVGLAAVGWGALLIWAGLSMRKAGDAAGRAARAQ